MRHALQRDAVYHALDPARRFALHAAATPLVDEHSAWLHRVASSDRVNEDLATRLEREAERNREQPDRAATLLLWAADLSEDRERREHRLTEAAVVLVIAARTARALTLRQAVLGCRPSPLRQALLGAMATARGEPQNAERFLTEAVATADDDHTRLLAALWLSGHYLLWNRTDEALPVLLRALNLPLPDVQLARALRSLFALALAHSDGPLAGLSALGDLGLPSDAQDVPLPDSPLLAPRGTLRGLAGELTAGITDLTALVEREPGTVLTDTAASGYAYRGLFQYLTGAWDAGMASTQEALTLTGAQERHPALVLAHAVAAMILAGRGARDDAERHLRACERAAGGATTLYPLIARATAGQAEADHPAMAAALADLSAAPGSVRRTWQLLWRPLEAEALVETRAEGAPAFLEGLRKLADEVPCLRDASTWLTARHTTLGGNTDAALDLLRTGLAAPAPVDRIALHHTRLLHVYARLLLEIRERRAAAPLLRTAHQQYQALGAEPFARRVADDLVACGAALDTAPLGPADTIGQLTEREMTIARLTAAGNTNREIARQLCVSTKTVEYHLGHIYLKLGITSRRQLRPLLER
ncbi:helix-turn-helix transcriptional regulator [Kitasatospora purpeofusca]|nr:helix-turn-helix transcriptional regulator [Kitasatospora purpeofusca]